MVLSAESKSESKPRYWPWNGLLNTNLSPDAAYVIEALAPLIVIPAPFAAIAESAESANIIFLSLIETVVELIIVCTPSTVRFPKIVTLPVASPTAAGSIIKFAGPLISLNVTVSPVPTDCPIDITPVFESYETPVPPSNDALASLSALAVV